MTEKPAKKAPAKKLAAKASQPEPPAGERLQKILAQAGIVFR